MVVEWYNINQNENHWECVVAGEGVLKLYLMDENQSNNYT